MAIRYRQDSRTSGPEHLVDASGITSSQGRLDWETHKVLPSGTTANIRQRERRYRMPAAPEIPRLPTPDLEPISLDCPCCIPNDEESYEGHWSRGRAKIDKQLTDAKAHIARSKKGGRLIAEA
ncbi:hypothetical protein F5Y15DRAFT_416961 [Xylariaceae sp. FL0016]|nr:hypothetical protein F5Y15DRAFT_416961 [Xylariaceae sp. FL0016]